MQFSLQTNVKKSSARIWTHDLLWSRASKAENTRMPRKGKYHFTADLQFVCFGFICITTESIYFLVWSDVIQPTRRSAPFVVSESTLCTGAWFYEIQKIPPIRIHNFCCSNSYWNESSVNWTLEKNPAPSSSSSSSSQRTDRETHHNRWILVCFCDVETSFKA